MNLTGVAGVDPSVPASQDDRQSRLRSIARESTTYQYCHRTRNQRSAYHVLNSERSGKAQSAHRETASSLGIDSSARRTLQSQPAIPTRCFVPTAFESATAPIEDLWASNDQ
jgi:hypothetical protein